KPLARVCNLCADAAWKGGRPEIEVKNPSRSSAGWAPEDCATPTEIARTPGDGHDEPANFVELVEHGVVVFALNTVLEGHERQLLHDVVQIIDPTEHQRLSLL